MIKIIIGQNFDHGRSSEYSIYWSAIPLVKKHDVYRTQGAWTNKLGNAAELKSRSTNGLAI